MEEKFLKLTNTVYKALEFFPESDPLKYRAKDKALVIMENLVFINETSGWASFQKEKIKTQILEDIDILLGYLWIGKSQGWLNSVNCLIIANEYEKIKKEIGHVIEINLRLPGIDAVETKPIKPEERPDPVLDDTKVQKENAPDYFVISDSAEPTSAKASARQGKILEFLIKNEKAQVMDLQTILPDITKRTIRRDLDELLGAGKIIRLGDFNQIFYKLNG